MLDLSLEKITTVKLTATKPVAAQLYLLEENREEGENLLFTEETQHIPSMNINSYKRLLYLVFPVLVSALLGKGKKCFSPKENWRRQTNE